MKVHGEECPCSQRVLKVDYAPIPALGVMVDLQMNDRVCERESSRNRRDGQENTQWPMKNCDGSTRKLHILGKHSAQNGLEKGCGENLEVSLMLWVRENIMLDSEDYRKRRREDGK